MRILRFDVILTCSVVALSLAGTLTISAKSPSTTNRDKLIGAVTKEPPRTDYHIRYQPSETDRAVSHAPDPGLAASALSGSPPPPSPGIVVGTTWLDLQQSHSQGKQIARKPGSDYVHMVWSSIQNFDSFGEWDEVDVEYNSFRISTNSLVPGSGGEPIGIGPPAHAQYANVDVDDAGAALVLMAEREDVSFPRSPWAVYLPSLGNTFHVDDALSTEEECGEALWPKVAVQQRAGVEDLRHVIARSGYNCDDERLFYWRYDSGVWSGPALIDSAFSQGCVIAADNNSNKVAIVFHDIDEPASNGANNISYYESTTSGLGWISGSELGPTFKRMLTNYHDTLSGSQAWLQIDAVYDHAGALHIIWDEQRLANKTTDAAIRHWSSSTNLIRPVVLGYWANPFLSSRRLNLTGLSIGIGEGTTLCSGHSNLDNVYVLYTKFAGTTPAEQADVAGAPSSHTHPNGELYLVSSNTAGDTWGPPQNLTNTKTPNCRPSVPDSVCRSEDWATLSKSVSDIDILYISDRDAGPAPQNIGTYQPNDVMYLRFPGGTANAQYLCPVLSAGFAATMTSNVECEYHAEPGTIKNDETLTIMNLGNATLSGTIAVLSGAPWLTIPGSGVYTIPAGGADRVYTPVMNATGLTEGLYTGTIRINHNDPSKPTPQDIPVSFFVISGFDCPQGAVISTGAE